MILDIAIFVGVVAVFYAACFFAFCLACALVGVVGYLLFGVFLYIISPGFRRDVHLLMVEVVKMTGRGAKRAVQWAASATGSALKAVFHPVTTLRGHKKTGKYIVGGHAPKRSTQDGSSWSLGVDAVIA